MLGGAAFWATGNRCNIGVAADGRSGHLTPPRLVSCASSNKLQRFEGAQAALLSARACSSLGTRRFGQREHGNQRKRQSAWEGSNLAREPGDGERCGISKCGERNRGNGERLYLARRMERLLGTFFSFNDYI